MNAVQQLIQTIAKLSRAFDQQVSALPVLGPLFLPKWHLIQSDHNGEFALITKDGLLKIPQQIPAKQIKGRNCLRLVGIQGQLRKIRLPEAAIHDPVSAVRLALDTVSPIAPEDTAFAVQSTTAADDKGMFEAKIALASKRKINQLVQQGADLGIVFAAIDVFDSEQQQFEEPVVNLITGQPTFARFGPTRLLASICGLALALALALNLWATWQLEPKQARLQAQAKPAGFAIASLHKADREQRLSIIETWNAVTIALPDNAWVESMSIDGNQLRLAGHASNAATLINALESSPALSQAGFAAASVQEEGGRESFDIQAIISVSEAPS